MKRIILIITTTLMMGCIQQPTVPTFVHYPNYHIVEVGVVHPDVIYIGDSLCYSSIDNAADGSLIYGQGLTAMEQAGIGRDCKSGRAATDYPDQLPSGYRIIFYALVTNDVNWTPLAEYRSDLQAKLSSTDAIVYCVLPIPIVKGHDSTAYANVMREECTNVIDKMDYITSPFALDGYHETAQQHAEFTPAITSRL